MKRDPLQMDFFSEPAFPVRSPVQQIDLDRYRAKMKRAMARAIRECHHDRPTIAARMSLYLGVNITKAMLDAWTAESKRAHDMTIPRFAAFVHATEAPWLWDEAAGMQGVTVLVGREAQLAEIGLLRQEQQRVARELKALLSTNVEVAKRARS
ncbi:hypothetical protein BG46_01305 [Brucella anthropi]|uniref:hypothetical protein n=1 Tax=Brucella anthropi TaxID=529 RepID=UPI0004474B7D|nr:hypothetical protein [Brucella anthropi]EXL08196.1 hypothetical protein BG46_01305 [Brucella anthropi]